RFDKLATAYRGLSFTLPSEMFDGVVNNPVIDVALMDGSPLPSWLRFVPETHTFVATEVPEGALPLKVVVTVAGRSRVITIETMTQSRKVVSSISFD
ncbi:MAG: hypothetical protein WCH35_16470, partial [Comamonadaceae bacterium]